MQPYIPYAVPRWFNDMTNDAIGHIVAVKIEYPTPMVTYNLLRKDVKLNLNIHVLHISDVTISIFDPITRCRPISVNYGS